MQAPCKLNRTHWIAPDVEWLKHERFDLGKTFRAIAEEQGCDRGLIQKWNHALGLVPDRPVHVGTGKGKGQGRVLGVTREWLYDQYVTQDKSMEQIGVTVGTTREIVWKWLHKYGIKPRTREQRNERHSVRMSGEGNPAYAGGTSQNYHKRLALKLRGPACEWCRREDDPQVHHRDHNRENGDPDNLRILCGHCNVIEARLWNLEQLGFAAHEYDPEDHVLTIRFGR